MLRPYLFFFLLFIGTGSVVVSIERLLTVDPFLNVSDPFLINNDGLSGPILGQIKKFHGLSADPYDVGIFGSSTSMMVTAQNLDVNECRVFNFSILGESLRSSVVFIEAMANEGKLPPIVLIGVDNFEVQNYGNSRIISVHERIREMFRDVLAAFQEPRIKYIDATRMILRHLITQRDVIERKLNIDLVAAAVRSLFSTNRSHPLLTDVGSGFRADGTYDWKRAYPTVPHEIMRSRPRAILPGYLRYDLKRVYEATRDKTDVYIFETPVEPISQSYFMEHPGSVATRSRNEFLKACLEFGLRCFQAPERLSDDPLIWKDHVHAPPAQLGAYFKTFVPDMGKACSN
jgi:hypothetical protein